jgi:hypothetical protein
MTTATITEKQANYIEALIEKELELGGNFSTRFTLHTDIFRYTIAVNMTMPEDKEEASVMIDALKAGGSVEYARRNPELAQRIQNMMRERYGDVRNVHNAISDRYDSLDKTQKIQVQDSKQAWREIVLNPLLSV